MSYGLNINNPSGQLVISSDGAMPSYLGKATFVSTTQTDGASCGYSTLTYSHSTAIVPVIQLQDHCQSYIATLSQSGTTWTILVHHADTTSVDSNGFCNQVAPTVYVWGLPTASPSSSYGLALYNASGALSCDLTAPPLRAAATVNWSSTGGPQTLTGVVKPGIIGMLMDWKRNSSPSGAVWQVGYYSGAWYYTLSSNQLSRGLSQVQYYPTEDTDNGGTSIVNQAATAIIVDLNGLT